MISSKTELEQRLQTRERRYAAVRGRPLAVAALLLVLGAPRAISAADADAATFPARVNRAIQRGRKALHGQLERVYGNPRNYPMGRIALCVTALLKAGAASDDALIEKCFKKLDSLRLDKTYSVSCYIFALDAAWQRQVIESTTRPTYVAKPRIARGKIRSKMEELVEWLVRARLPGEGVWDYQDNSDGYDHSNTQFAVLALEIAVDNQIPVPKEVFREIADHAFANMTRGGSPRDLRLTLKRPLEEAFNPAYTQKRKKVRVQPGGWSYKGKGEPTTSMTAAGASNLLVVRRALEKANSLGKISTLLDRATYSAMVWMSGHLDEFISGGARPYYYTIYSLEKVGDLGHVHEIDGRDWYREGAEALLSRQRDDGSWGNHEDTSFALLFLTRATQPKLQALPPPTILTSTGEPTDRKSFGDKVYVDSLKGFVSANEFFIFLMQVRNSKLVPMAEEIVDNYPVHRQEELVPYLIKLWNNRSDGVTNFARKALATITGLKRTKREEYANVYKNYRAAVALIEAGSRDPSAVGGLLMEAESLALKNRLLQYIERQSIGEACDALIRELEHPDKAYRQSVLGALERLTGSSLPRPQGEGKKAWADLAAGWQEWWNGNQGTVAQRFRVRNLVAALGNESLDDEKRAQVLDELVGEGANAVPAILDSMKRRHYRLEFLLALERISGERRGLLVEDWQSWWDGRAGARRSQ